MAIITIKRMELDMLIGIVWIDKQNNIKGKNKLINKLKEGRAICGPKLHDKINLEFTEMETKQIKQLL